MWFEWHIIILVMKQNEFNHTVAEIQQDTTFLNFLQAQHHCFAFNRLKLEAYNPKDPSPWLDTDRQCFKRPFHLQNVPLSKRPVCQLQLKFHRNPLQIKKKRRFEDHLTKLKLNNTLVEFSVKYKPKETQERALWVHNSSKSSVKSGLTQQRLDTIRRQNEEQTKPKTPKIKFLEQKFKIRDGTSCRSRTKRVQSDKNIANNESSLSLISTESMGGFVQSHKTVDDKSHQLKAYRSRQLNSKWFNDVF